MVDNIRPKLLNDFMGQPKLKRNLEILIGAAKKRGDVLDHILFYGPPGLGKTTLALIIANEMETKATITAGPIIKKNIEIITMLLELKRGDILFIDEIHRLKPDLEETLYPVMEDFILDFVIGTGKKVKPVRVPLPKFTLIGATTRQGLLTAPFRARFGAIYHLEYYNQKILAQIINRSASVLNMTIDKEAAFEIAKRSRGTPRIANRLLKRVRDYTQFITNQTNITDELTKEALNLLEIDKLGLDNLDRKILRVIIDKFDGGPVGLSTLTAALEEDAGTISDIIEPYLLQLGMLERAPRGRIATKTAYAHLGIPFVNSI